MRRTSWLWLLLFLMCLGVCLPGFGEAVPYSFPQDGIRLYLPEEWQVLTQDNLADKAQEIESLGTTPQALAAGFAASGTLLEAFPPEGGQISVRRQPLPEGLAVPDAYMMSESQKEDFLMHIARSGSFGRGSFDGAVPEFAVFRGSASLQALSVQTIAYATVRYGQVYTVSTEIIGREPAQQDEEALYQAASSLLFLGKRAQAAEPEAEQAPRATLHLAPTPTPEPAEVKVQRDETPLALDYAPSVSHTSRFTLEGKTEPNTPLRYYVNGKGYERYTSDEEGRFAILVRSLPKAGKNTVSVQAIGENGYGSVVFTVQLEQARTPVAVTPVAESVAGDSVVLTGSVLPGSQVQVVHRLKTYDAQVAEDGSFSCKVYLPKIGDNTFSVRATLAGYLRGDVDITVSRVRSEVDEQAAFLKKAKQVAYSKLMAKPQNYADTPVRYEGTVVSLSGLFAKPLAVVATEGNTNFVAVLCEDLSGLEIGQKAVLLCTLTGTVQEVSFGGQTLPMPEARLMWLLPSD